MSAVAIYMLWMLLQWAATYILCLLGWLLFIVEIRKYRRTKRALRETKTKLALALAANTSITSSNTYTDKGIKEEGKKDRRHHRRGNRKSVTFDLGDGDSEDAFSSSKEGSPPSAKARKGPHASSPSRSTLSLSSPSPSVSPSISPLSRWEKYEVIRTSSALGLLEEMTGLETIAEEDESDDTIE